MRRSTLILLCSFAIQPAMDSASAQTLDSARIAMVADSVAHAQISAGGVPGMSVAVAQNGKIVFTRGYGVADVEMGVAARPETVYEIGSLTKQFTAAAVMRLVEQGKISLKDPITKYLSDYPVQGHHVTVRHLLNHTSGIKRSPAPTEVHPQLSRLDHSYEDLVTLLGNQPFDFAPGEAYRYNNFGYELLGEIIKRVTGTAWGEYVEGQLLQPLGLEQIVHCEHTRIIPQRAEGYEHVADELVNAPFRSRRFLAAAGALCSTTRDLVRWTHLLHNGSVVTPGSLQQMITPTVLSNGDTISYGYGFDLREFAGRKTVLHSGKVSGFTAMLFHVPEEGLTIAVLANVRVEDAVEKVVQAVARTALIRDLTLTAAEQAPYAGTYTYPSGSSTAELRVFPEDGRLKVQTARGVTQLLSQGDHVFIHGEDPDIRFNFIVENGRAEGITLHMGRRVISAARKP